MKLASPPSPSHTLFFKLSGRDGFSSHSSDHEVDATHVRIKLTLRPRASLRACSTRPGGVAVFYRFPSPSSAVPGAAHGPQPPASGLWARGREFPCESRIQYSGSKFQRFFRRRAFTASASESVSRGTRGASKLMSFHYTQPNHDQSYSLLALPVIKSVRPLPEIRHFSGDRLLHRTSSHERTARRHHQSLGHHSMQNPCTESEPWRASKQHHAAHANGCSGARSQPAF